MSYSVFPPLKKNKTPIWLISITDLIAIMLTFFVMLFSMSELDPKLWDKGQIAQSDNIALSESMNRGLQNDIILDLTRQNYANAFSLKYIRSLFLQLQGQNEALKIFRITDTRNSVRLSLSDLQTSDFSKSNQIALQELAQFISAIPNAIEIIVFSDFETLTSTEGYLSETDRSLDKAFKVSQILKESGYKKTPFLFSELQNGKRFKKNALDIHILPTTPQIYRSRTLFTE